MAPVSALFVASSAAPSPRTHHDFQVAAQLASRGSVQLTFLVADGAPYRELAAKYGVTLIESKVDPHAAQAEMSSGAAEPSGTGGLLGRLFGAKKKTAGGGSGRRTIAALAEKIRASGAAVVMGADARFTALGEAASRAGLPVALIHQTASEATDDDGPGSALDALSPQLSGALLTPGSSPDCFAGATRDAAAASAGSPWIVDYSNGVDPARFASLDRAAARQALIEEFSADPDAEFVVFAGTISHDDGVDLLWEAAYDLFFRWPRMHFLLIGPDGFDAAFVDDVKHTAAESDFDDRFHFVGGRDDLAPYLAGANLFALPTRTDAQPVAILEAMAAGLPIVTTDPGSIPSMMNEGLIAFLHPTDDPQPIQEGIEKVLMVADVRERYTKGVAERAADFTIAGAADALEKLIVGLAGK